MNAPPPLQPPPRGHPPDLRHAFGGVWRLTFRPALAPGQWLVAGILFAALAALMLMSVPTGNAERYLLWFIRVHLTLLVPVLAFLSGAGAIRDDMKPGPTDYVLTRPVPRRAFVVFRYVAHTTCVQATFLPAFGILVGIGIFRQIPDLASVAPQLLLAQLTATAAFVALGFLCGSMTSRYLVLGLLYAGIIEAGIGRIPIQINRLSILHHIRTIVEQDPGGLGADLWAPVAYSLGIAVVLLAVAVILFSMREFRGDQPREA